ncbi:MAG: XRE family transcriptional regulator [Rhodopila sp.]
MIMLITPEQIRAARALLRLDQAALAREASISVVTLRRLEEPHGLAKVAPSTAETVRRTLEKVGAEFIDQGVRRRAPSREAVAAIKREVDRIVARSSAMMAQNPPLTDDDLYDENGL